MRFVSYIITSSLIYQARFFLFDQSDDDFIERMTFVTGAKLSNELIVLTQLVKVKAKLSTEVGVQPDPADLNKKHISLLKMGMDFEAQFHSHPGTTEKSANPSLIDLGTARRWEKDAPFIGAVFGDGGNYVRFFNHSQKSTVHIIGNGINRVDESLFEISKVPGAQNLSEDFEIPEIRTDGSPREIRVVEPSHNQLFQSVRNWLRRPRRSYITLFGPDGSSHRQR